MFRDLAEVNEYQILFLWISNRWGYTRTTSSHFVEKNPIELINVIADVVQQGKGDAFVTIALRRTSGNEFRIPEQGKYKEDIEIKTLKESILI